MAELVIQNPSITPNDFGYDGGAISSILGAPLVGAGGGTIIESDFVWLPSVTNEGVISWQRATSATAPSTANIMGPQGNPGAAGAKGQDGANGVSPTVSFRDITDTEHSNGGTEVTITDVNGAHTYSAWNGNDGEGFIEAHHYQSLSAGYADYARFSDNSVSSMDQIKGSIDWGNEIAQEYKTHSGYFVTSAANLFDTTHKYGLVKDNQGNVSWGPISEGVANVSHDNTLVGNGNTEQLGVAWSALSGRTIENANNATNTTYATNLGDSNSHSGLSDITNAFATKQPIGTYATSGTIPNDNKQYALTHNGWAEVQGGGSSYTFDNTAANKTLSGGTGASNDPIGVNTAQFYRKTETSGTSELTNAFDQKVEYYTRTDSEAALKAQKLFVCTGDSDIIDKVSHADGKGCIFFRLG